MPSCKSVYEPQEDSTMLERYVRQYAEGKVLDVGTGSGIQAIAAAQSSGVKSVLAADVQKGVIDYCRKNIKNKKIRFIQSDLFENIRGKFDTVTFNPPYLPHELKLKDLTIEGGKKGYEVIEKFLSKVNNFLNPNGNVLIVFSSLTKKEKVEEFIKNNLLDFEELEKAHFFFEDIYVYLLRKNGFLKKLESKKITNVGYLAKGHRGLLFTGTYRNKKVAIKAQNPQSTAFGRIANEAKWLKKLNKHGLGAKLLFSSDNYLVYEYIEGDFIVEWIRKASKNNIKKIIKKIFSQMFLLDKLKIDKEEMHHPLKHITISKNKPFLIDFERTHNVESAKNVTQFCQFVTSGYLSLVLAEKGITIDKSKIIESAKIYKSRQSVNNLRQILNLL